jgi:hypothetical protein
MFHLALARQNALCGRRREEEGECDESDGKGKWGKGDYGWEKWDKSDEDTRRLI